MVREHPGSRRKEQVFPHPGEVHTVKKGFSGQALSNPHLPQVVKTLNLSLKLQASNVTRGKAVCISLLPLKARAAPVPVGIGGTYY
ncbi:hypothetical protein CEXT_471491 [Caerostris extrusa]|uniref:Uncharacterized protein n=1 Tax=Caerostris extrusa TaxID=172846 RepID=A0AAV4U2H6_CAEEX|nr:hypothetical protein CEXT_471491 [Caerostris extrusa]